jgi:hypothetical protein
MIAPAPARSSIAGRSEPSGHRSPAGMTAIRLPARWAQAATADALRRQPATTVAPLAIASSAIVAPFGDGKTSRKPHGASTSEDGASE